ncbi:cytochrome P450 [Pseudofrankia sp. BMG5.37]|uniref:cytochrome P450 n=1 Tax=Pseudofrankia sp. BMG5.37 TaxID=3050035 RepID=UPI002894086B|nr:cytochrome P450 [Pseudofrankia sp. BMG5.37]MDT3441893.1 cytochrome P450 [Pseudofrankia sp. BMG5.37]
MTTQQAQTAESVDFDHHSPAYAEHWRETYADLRGRCPVAHSTAHGGFTVLTRYADVEAVVKDDASFSSRHDPDPASPFKGITLPEAPVISTPIEMDPPLHTAYRKYLNPWFSPGRSKAYEPFVRSVTTAMLDAVIETGTIDLVHDLASPVPALLTAQVLGVPLTDWRLYSDAAHSIVFNPPGTAEFEAAVAKNLKVLEHCFQTVLARRAEPKDDLISVFVDMEIDGEKLSDQRIVEMCNLVIAGGNDTTTSLLANAFAWLVEHPDQRAWLAADPARIPAACEEFLRYFTPTQALARTVTRDVEIGGCPLREGDRVLISFAAANQDPEMFDRPDEVVLGRWPNRHQAFGLGAHRCLGSNLTRVEFRVVLEEVLRRIPDFQIDFTAAQRYPTIGIVNGWIDMPAVFTPGGKVGSDFVL